MKTPDRQVYPANKRIEIFYRINPSTNYFTIILDLFAKLKFPACQFCKKPEYPFYKTERQGTIRNTGKVSRAHNVLLRALGSIISYGDLI